MFSVQAVWVSMTLLHRYGKYKYKYEVKLYSNKEFRLFHVFLGSN